MFRLGLQNWVKDAAVWDLHPYQQQCCAVSMHQGGQKLYRHQQTSIQRFCSQYHFQICIKPQWTLHDATLLHRTKPKDHSVTSPKSGLATTSRQMQAQVK